jgi:hypothetical protein
VASSKSNSPIPYPRPVPLRTGLFLWLVPAITEIEKEAEQDGRVSFGSDEEELVYAIRFALYASDVAILHGPLGTGKITAVVELIRQAVRRRGQNQQRSSQNDLQARNPVRASRRFPARVVPAG